MNHWTLALAFSIIHVPVAFIKYKQAWYDGPVHLYFIDKVNLDHGLT